MVAGVHLLQRDATAVHLAVVGRQEPTVPVRGQRSNGQRGDGRRYNHRMRHGDRMRHSDGLRYGDGLWNRDGLRYRDGMMYRVWSGHRYRYGSEKKRSE